MSLAQWAKRPFATCGHRAMGGLLGVERLAWVAPDSLGRRFSCNLQLPSGSLKKTNLPPGASRTSVTSTPAPGAPGVPSTSKTTSCTCTDRARLALRSLPDRDRTGRSRRRQLNEAKLVADCGRGPRRNQPSRCRRPSPRPRRRRVSLPTRASSLILLPRDPQGGTNCSVPFILERNGSVPHIIGA